MDSFADKVVFITGAGQGIGFEIAKQFYLSGAKVYLNDINLELCKKAVGKIDDNGERCIPVPGDASDNSFINGSLDFIINKSNQLDIVIANAGITIFKKFFEVKNDELSRILDLNIKGTFMLIQGAAIRMKNRGIRGKLIVMSSITSQRAHKDLAAYGMTKAALESLIRNLVLELSPLGITINAIAPGATMTERTAQDKNYNTVWSKITPMGRPSTTEDIANLTLFLASDKSDQITGQTFIIDGGWSASSPGPE